MKKVLALNAKLKSLSRLLIPLTYTEAGQFDHDPAWNLPHIPTLAKAPDLASIAADTAEYQYLKTSLVRGCNRVNFILRQALELLADGME